MSCFAQTRAVHAQAPAPTSAAPAPAAEISEEAKARFAAGVNLLKDPGGARYEEAYREFKAAYAASPVYKILNNLGLCAMKLERDEEAIPAYEKYLADGKDLIDAAVAQQVKTDLQTLKAGLVWITVSSNQPRFTIVDARVPVRGERITNAYGPFDKPTRVGIHSGAHVLTARSEGFPDVTWEFDTTGQKEMPAHAFEFKQAPVAQGPSGDTGPKTVRVQERPIPTSVIVGGVATGLFAIGTVVTGVVGLSKQSDYKSANDGRSPDKAQSLKESGETMNLVSDVLLAGTVVGAAVTAVFYLSRPTVEVERLASGETRRVRAASAPLRLAPMISRDGTVGGVLMGGALPWQM